MSGDVSNGVRFYLGADPAFLGLPRYSAATHEADGSTTPLNMWHGPNPTRKLVERKFKTTPSGDIFLGSWVSPALSASAVCGLGTWTFAIACKELHAGCNFFLKHFLYLLRNGAYQATILAAVTEATEASVLVESEQLQIDTVNSGDGNGLSVTGTTRWYNFSFVPKRSGPLSKFIAALFKVGNPTGNAVMSIRATNNGSDLASASVAETSFSGSAALVTFAFAAPAYVTAGTRYYGTLRHDGTGTYDASNRFGWHTRNNTGGATVYPEGESAFSDDSGGTWTPYVADFQCQIYMTPEDTRYIGRKHTASVGTGVTAQDGDRLVYELLATAAAPGVAVAFGGRDLVSDESTTIYDPASYIECNNWGDAGIWSTWLAKPGVSVVPVVALQAPHNLVLSTQDVNNLAAPAHGVINSINPISRSIGDEYGQYAVSDVSLTVGDVTDGYLKQAAVAPTFDSDDQEAYHRLTGTLAVIYGLLRRGSQIDYRPLMTGMVYTFDQGTDGAFSFRIKASTDLETKVPTAVCDQVTFPYAPSGSVDKPLPVVYGVALAVPCLYVDTGGYKFVAAAGYIDDITAVYTDGALLSTPADYTWSRKTGLPWGDGYYAEIDLVANPGSSAITADVRGMQTGVASGVMMTDPSACMAHFLKNYSAVKEVGTDIGAFAAATALFTTRGMTMGGAIHTAQVPLSVLLKEWSDSFDVDFYTSRQGRLAIVGVDFASAANTIARRIPAEHVLPFQAQYKESLATDAVTIKYGLSQTAGTYAYTYKQRWADRNAVPSLLRQVNAPTDIEVGGTYSYKAQTITCIASQQDRPVSRLRLRVKKVGTPVPQLALFMVRALDASLSTVNAWYLSASGVTTSYVWYDLIAPASSLMPWAGTYYLIAHTSGTVDAANYYKIGGMGTAYDTLYRSSTGLPGAWTSVGGESMELQIFTTADSVDASVETDRTVNAKWVRADATAAALHAQRLRKTLAPQPIFFPVETDLASLSLELGQLVEINHGLGLGSGLYAHQAQVRADEFGFGSAVRLLLRSNDVFDGAVLGDDADGATNWSSASVQDRRNLYLCNDETAALALKFADGRWGKSLCAD